MTAVLVYHVWPQALPGGFVGVDIFFVISGFLLGTHLLEELDATSTVRLGRFWARRAKRLLPAALLVLFTVSVFILVFAPLSLRQEYLHEVIGSALYVENWVLAHKAVDYLAMADAVSPVQHYWSLSAEEQFYVGLPLLLLLISLLTRVRTRGLGLDTVAILTGVTLASFGYSIYLTGAEPSVAYFSTWTRAWEFLTGVLLGCFVITRDPGIRVRLGWTGLVLAVGAMFVIDDATAFPGWVALMPVAGAIFVIAAGDAGPMAWLSQWRPVTWLGDVSYAVYLWHWPLLVLVPYATGEPLAWWHKVAILVATLVLAWASTTFVELPIRTAPRFLGGARPAWVVGVACATASTVVVAFAVSGSAFAGQQLERRQAAIDEQVTPSVQRCLGAAALDPKISGCQDLGDLLVPDPSSARLDDGNRAACWVSFGESVLRICTLGPQTDATKRVLVVGDSHSNQYLPAYARIARELGWRIDVAGRAGCFWGTRPQVSPTRATTAECLGWKRKVAAHLDSSPPYDLIITTAARGDSFAVSEPGETPAQATVDSISRAWRTQIARGTPVVAIRDNPRAAPAIAQCLELHGYAGRGLCANPRVAATGRFDAMAEAVAATPGSALVDLFDLICPGAECPAVIGNVVVYRNNNHLTATFIRTLVPYLAERIMAAEEQAREAIG